MFWVKNYYLYAVLGLFVAPFVNIFKFFKNKVQKIWRLFKVDVSLYQQNKQTHSLIKPQTKL